MSAILWTQEDAIARRCGFIDVGTPRIEPESKVEVPERPTLPTLTDQEVLEALPVKVLKRDALRAYQALGGAEWLARSPVLLGKILMRLLPVEVNSDERTTLDIKITWAGPERLSYQRAEVIEAREPWKEPESDGLAQTMRMADKK